MKALHISNFAYSQIIVYGESIPFFLAKPESDTPFFFEGLPSGETSEGFAW